MNSLKYPLALVLGLFLFASNAMAQSLAITTSSPLPQAYLDEPLSPIQLQATGGTAPYTWSLLTGSPTLVGKIAPGLSVTTSGQIIGTPTAIQALIGFKVRVVDSSPTPKAVEKILSIAVIHAPPVLTLTPMKPGFAGSSYSWTFNATQGKPPYGWSTTTTLPAGLALASATGILSGNIPPTQPAGNFTLAITATGSNGVKASGNFVLSIFAPLSWVSNSSLPGGKVAHDYSTNVSAAGGIAPYAFALKTGSTLPAGLSLNSSTGLVSGAPTTAGNASFTIIAQDSANPPNSIERTFSLGIAPYGMSVSGPASVEGIQFLAIAPAQFSVNEGIAAYTWSTVPQLPTGLTINASTGLISGKLMGVPGNFSVSVFVKDGKNQTASAPLTIASTPSGPLEWVTAEALAGGKVASAYSQNLTAKGGKPAYTFALKTGSTLPTGLKLATTGFLSGTPTVAGNYTFTVTAKDTASPVNVIERTFTLAVQAYGMSINGPATITIKRYQALPPATFAVDGGTAPFSWKSNPTLPAGMTLNATTGVLSGTPTASAGTYPVVISVSDSKKQIATHNCTITIEPTDPFEWVTAEALPGGKVASAYSQNLTATGGKPAYTYATKNGSTLPAGLKLATTGLLSGAPTAAGNYTFTVTAKDTASPVNIIERTFTLVVQAYGMSINGPATISIQRYQALPPATFTADGGTAPFSWKSTPALPVGMTLNATTGVLSGTPTASAGNYPVVISATDSKKQTIPHNCTITIEPTDPFEWVTAEALPGGKVASAYSQNLTATGGKPAFTFATKNGSTLPAGLKLATTGLLSGTPTAAGNYTFTVTAKDTASPVNGIERTFTLAVQAYGMSINGPATISIKRYQALPPATFTADGGTAPFSWKSNPTLPAGMTLNATTGVLSGTPTASAGTYPVVISATDSKKQIVPHNCTITIEPTDPFAWVTAEALPGGKVASAYSQNLTATGGKPAYTYATKNGSTLPAGLKLATTGLLSGAPTASGNYTFTVTAKDTASPVNGIERTFTLAVQAYGMVITDNSPSEISGIQFQPLTPTPFAVLGGVPVYKWSSTPTPPAGLTLNSTTGILSGVPSVAGNTTIAVRITDGANQTVTKNCTIRILPAGNLTITTASPLPSATVNTSYSTTLAASGGKPFLTANQSTYYNWTIANRGNLPTNFTLNATSGILSGTANAVLTANFTVRVTDAANAFTTKNCTLQITGPLDSGDADGDGVNNYREFYDGTNANNSQSFNPLSLGLVAHYPFDGNARDDSGYGNHGITYGGATLSDDRFGHINSAYIFDGINDYMDIGNPVGNNPADFTQSTWVKILKRTNLERDTLITKRHADGVDWASLCIGSTEYTGSPELVLDDSNYIHIAHSPVSVELNQWAFVCGVKQGSSYKIYVNGVLKNSFTDTRSMEGSNLNMHLMHHGAWNRYTNGALDEVRIYNRALSAAEVSQLYSEESGEPNMVLVQGGTLPQGSRSQVKSSPPSTSPASKPPGPNGNKSAPGPSRMATPTSPLWARAVLTTTLSEM